MDLHQKIKSINSICKRYIFSKIDQEHKAGLSKLKLISKKWLISHKNCFTYKSIIFIYDKNPIHHLTISI